MQLLILLMNNEFKKDTDRKLRASLVEWILPGTQRNLREFIFKTD